MEILAQIAGLVERGRADANSNYPRDMKGQPGVKEKVKEALAQGIPASQILNDGLTIGMRGLGQKFCEGEVFVPEVLMAAKAMSAGVEILRPLLQKSDTAGRGTFVVGTVEGDIHDIGKNLVKTLVEGSGWQVADLGVNVSPSQFVAAAREKQAVAVGLSALLTTTMEGMRHVVEALRDEGMDTPVLVGGAPLSEAYAREIGAVYGKDPSAAIEILERLVAKA
jgi:5-methyltetrahydrofolate--homocysteine methyltransferase